MSEQNIESRIAAYQAQGRCPAKRAAIVAESLHITKRVAETYCRRAGALAWFVDPADFAGDGVLGLIEAVDAFDPHRGIKFATFATHRVRGAMLDAIRQRDGVPRLVRDRERYVAGVHHDLEQQLGRKATEDEVAVTAGPVAWDDGRPFSIISLDAEYERHNSKGSYPRVLREGDTHADPRSTWLTDDMLDRDAFNSLLKGLNRSHRLMMTLYYREELTMREIGSVLGLSESRVSQMHTFAIDLLRAKSLTHENLKSEAA